MKVFWAIPFVLVLAACGEPPQKAEVLAAKAIAAATVKTVALQKCRTEKSCE